MIGGEHHLPCPVVDGNLAEIIHGIWERVEFRCTGRDAIHSAVSHLSPRRIWLPNYLCESVYGPVHDMGIPIHFYPVDRFDSADCDWDRIGQEGDAALLIHYFGIPQTHALESLRRRSVTTISDITHVLLNPSLLVRIARASDYSVCSLRKCAALPDGGFVASARHALPAADLPPREPFWTLRAAALLSRGGSASGGFGSDENFHLLGRAERSLDDTKAGNRAMSDCSRYRLKSLPWTEWSAMTARNAARLRERIGVVGVETCDGAYSHLFPILLDSRPHRDRVRSELLRRGIVAPIHWETSFLGEAHWISERILSLPCDHRYDEADMEYCAKMFQELR